MNINSFEKDNAEFIYEAESLLERNNLPEALNLARERLRLFPADANAYAVCCNALIGMGRIEGMREILNEVAEIISGLNLIYERAGDSCRENGFHQDAAFCYEKFISLHPGDEKVREVIGKMALLEQEDSPSVEVIDNQNIPEREFFTITLAELYIKQGHLQDAEIILEEIIRKEPQNTQALAMLDELKVPLISQSPENNEFSKTGNLIKALYLWLKNVERLRINAEKK